MNRLNRLQRIERRKPQGEPAQPTIDASRLSTPALKDLLNNRESLAGISQSTRRELEAAKVNP